MIRDVGPPDTLRHRLYVGEAPLRSPMPIEKACVQRPPHSEATLAT